MAEFRITTKGFNELKAAIRRNPRKVVEEAGKFLARGIAAYNRKIMRNPWTMSRRGGGAPVDSGNLRDTHHREIGTWTARIFPTAKYAPYVHGIEGYPRKRSYTLRPWLDYAERTARSEVRKLHNDMLKEITLDLAR